MTDFGFQMKPIIEQLHTVEQRQTVGNRFSVFEFDERELFSEDDSSNGSALLMGREREKQDEWHMPYNQ